MANDDEEFLSGLRNSDKNAYEILFRKYYASLFRQVWYRCRDRDLAEDIVQESFIRLWTGRDRLRPSRPLFPFLITISLNLLRDAQKHAGVALRHRESVISSGAPNAESPDEHRRRTPPAGTHLGNTRQASVREVPVHIYFEPYRRREQLLDRGFAGNFHEIGRKPALPRPDCPPEETLLRQVIPPA